MPSPRMVALVAGLLGALAGCDVGDKARSPAGAGGGGGAAASSGATTTTGMGGVPAAGASSASASTGGATTSAATTGATTSASTSAATSASTSGGPTSGLHVEGNKLVDGGNTVRLLGVDHSGSEYSCFNNSGFFDWGNSGVPDQAFVSNIVSWHANTVRVPLNEDCWLQTNGMTNQYTGQAYQSAISQYVSLLRQNNLYVIVDLHWNNGGKQQVMADAAHSPDFWTGVANAFKSDQGVVFDLYNEPQSIAWDCWQNGGCSPQGWAVAGMNQLISAVRGTGATNVVMAGGVSYSSDLSGWLANKPNDPMGNLAASFHTYNFTGCNMQSCWGSTIQGVAGQVPVVTGELGENDCAHGYIDGYMSWADGAGVSYLGWAWNADFNCNSGPGLVSDYGGTPTGFGAGIQAHLAAVNP